MSGVRSSRHARTRRAPLSRNPTVSAPRFQLDCLDVGSATQQVGEQVMRRIADIGAAVIGTGFIGTVHVEALRRIGVHVTRRAREHARAGRGPGRRPRRAARLPVPRGPAGRSRRRRRPRDLAEPPPRPADPGDPGGRPARRLREAAGADRRRVRRARRARRRERAGQRGQLQHPLLPAPPARPRPGRRRRARRRPTRHRALLPGLAPARHRLELAARAGQGRGAAGGRRHRVALAGPRHVPDRPAGRRGDGRPRHVHPRAGPAERAGRDRSRPSAAATRSSARWRPRTWRASCFASPTARAARSPCRRSAPAARTRSSGRSTARPARPPGTRRRPITCGSATATGPTRSSSATRP